MDTMELLERVHDSVEDMDDLANMLIELLDEDDALALANALQSHVGLLKSRRLGEYYSDSEG